MDRLLRRSLLGVLAGALSSAALVITVGHPLLSILLGLLVGAGYSASLKPTRGTYVDNLMAGGALGVPLWGLISVIAIPFFSSRMPEWDAEQMRVHFPALVGWVMYGAALGLLTQTFSDLAARYLGVETEPESETPRTMTRIVILGGGFAGMRTAECLEAELRTNPEVSLTLVSETNALLFTPMLAEVAGSSLEPSHISTPLRSTLHRTEFVRGRATEIDLEKRRVILANGPAAGDGTAVQEIAYDHLVFALGAVSNYLGMSNLEKYSFNFKSLLDAIRIRNHVIEMFERADCELDQKKRQALLTFVIVGGGFAGVELAGALNDYAHGILADYPKLRREEVSVVLVHSRDRILPELSESLGRYAQERMAARGVVFRLNTRISDAGTGLVVLSDGEIRAETLVWTAGTAPNPLLKALALDKDKRGALIVNDTLAIPGSAGLWALGDCRRSRRRQNEKALPANRAVRLARSANIGKKHPQRITRRHVAEIPFRFTRSLVRRRPPNRLRGIDRALRA